ncbi:MAG: carbon-nitrogen hydrolase family protein [bacterium]
MTHKTIRLAVIQFARDRFKPDKNIRRMKNFLRRVEGADLVCLPEAWVVMKKIDESDEKELLAEFGEIAAKNKFTLVTGGIFIAKNSKFNQKPRTVNLEPRTLNPKLIKDVCHVIGSDGKLAGTVEKIFPSFPLGERNFCAPGDRLPIFEIAGAKVGVVICVDMLYPEICRSIAQRGAELILNPSNIPESRLNLWHALIQARAAENTVYTVFVSNTHTEYPDQRPVRGGSIVVAPWGDIIATAGSAEKILYVDIDINQVYETRKRWRYLDDINEVKISKEGKVKRKK